MKAIFTQIPFLLLSFVFAQHHTYGQGTMETTAIFINEIHYDNDGADTGEGVEVAGPAGTDLSGWSLVAYNGSNGTLYETVALSGILEGQSHLGTAFFELVGLQNGSPDGIGLIDESGNVVQFLSYEGTFSAVGGPADSLISEDIGVAETSGTAIGFSLQLSGSGAFYEDFTWSPAAENTYGATNSEQTFTGGTPVVFINELHYDNSSTDVNEGVEIAGTAGVDLNGWSLVAYNGNGGTSYSSLSLVGVLPDQQNNFGTLFFPLEGLQNGAPDGIALVNPDDSVIQFLSYEGTFIATDGPAQDMESSDIEMEESSSTSIDFSLQLSGQGTQYEDFFWQSPQFNTYAAINLGQVFGSGDPDPDPEPEVVTIAEARALPFGTTVIVYGTITVADEFGGPAYVQDETGGIPVFDPLLHEEGAFEIGDSVLIVAAVGAFQQQVQLVEVDSLVDFGMAVNPIVPTEINISEAAAYEGQLVTISQAGFANSEDIFFPNTNYEIFDETGFLDLRIDDNTNLVGRLKPQEPVDITGVLGSFQVSLQLLPRSAEDVPGTAAYNPGGSDVPFNATFDVATWNMEFFGSTIPNFGPNDVSLQYQNAIKVLDSLKADIIAVQEVSNDSLLAVLAEELTGAYEAVCSDIYSYSFEGEDDEFPPQKLCFLYNTEAVDLVEERVIFEEFYEAVRTSNSALLPDYPDEPSAFWASGRLPYMVTVNATIDGQVEEIRLINIHAISNSDAEQNYLRRSYDVQVLKDTLEAYYPNEQVILLGDYNDDVDEPVIDNPPSAESPYAIFVNDSSDYKVVTKTLSDAGFRSYVFEENVIDHVTITNELFEEYLEASETIFYPFDIVENYSSTTSDHLPVRTRLSFKTDSCLLAEEPEQIARDLGFTNVTRNSLLLSWERGSGDGRLVIARKWGRINESNLQIEDGTPYTDGSGMFGEGALVGNRTFVVYNGTADSVFVTGLQQKTIYAFAIVEYNVNECDTSVNYASEFPVKYVLTPGVRLPFGKINAYPNPVKDKLKMVIEGATDEVVTITILDNLGRAVFEETVISRTDQEILIPADWNNIASGLYFLKVSTKGENPQIIRFYKK